MDEQNHFNLHTLGVSVIGAFVLVTSSYASEGTPSMLADSGASIVNQAFAMNEFVYNPKSLQWKAINANGAVVRTGRGSAGRSYCPDIHRSCRTPTGTFHIISKGGSGCRSSRYPVGKGGAPMPYCMFFSKYYAVHGSYDVPNRNASHGCIRVKPQEARWLSNNFMQIGTKVVVGPY